MNLRLLPTKLLLFVGFMVAVAILLSPFCRARILLNYAQIKRLQGDLQPNIYLKALSLIPDNERDRLQTSIVLAESHEYAQSVAILLPLLEQDATNKECAELVLFSCLASQQQEKAIQVYQDMVLPQTVSPGIASRLLAIYWQHHDHRIPSDISNSLLKSMFGIELDASVFQFEGALSETDQLSKTEFIQRVRSSLMWRTNQPFSFTSNTSFIQYNDLHQKVSLLLNISPDTFEVGPELVRNGSFELDDSLNDHPRNWDTLFMSTGGAWNRGAFVIGTDNNLAISGNRSLRIDGLWVDNQGGREPARAGVWQISSLIPAKQVYVVSLKYLTRAPIWNPNISSVASLWLSQHKTVFEQQEITFPETYEKWNSVTIIARNRGTTAASLQIHPRLWSEGSVWFDDISVRTLSLPKSIVLQDSLVNIEQMQ